MAQEAQIIERFGKYELTKKIGQGGMAEVFLARLENDRPDADLVVIKRLHQELEKDRDAVDLFLTEADVTLLLEHPNIIRVYDSGEINGRYYMAMEYVHGKDLEQIFSRFVQKGIIMEPAIAVHIIFEVVKGLGYVHTAKTTAGRELGIVHRDVTPSNIFISSTGQVKLGDFGVAKLMGVERWTMSGSIKGKLGYLSPEQITGTNISQTIDLWAAAVILFEFVAGERLFVGENELDIMLRIRSAKIPSLRKINKSAPKVLQKILEKSLHKKEHKRFTTAQDFLDVLDDFLQAQANVVTPHALVQYLVSKLT